ncbi:MAG: PorT family protein [Cytophagaceae bacterium]|nr:PorT family protein [Cytophagaceae bacterium]
MKHIITTVSLLLLSMSATSVFAQDDKFDTREKFEVGVKAGINVSNVYDEKGDNFVADSKAGFAGGVYLSIPFNKYIGIQPEVLFSQKGFQSTRTYAGGAFFNDYTVKYSTVTNHIDIPLQLQIKPAGFITFVVGPQYSFVLSKVDKREDSSGNSNADTTNYNNDNIRKNILGVVGGVDFNIFHFVLSGRAGWDLQNNNGDGSSSNPRYKNAWYQLTVGAKF